MDGVQVYARKRIKRNNERKREDKEKVYRKENKWIQIEKEGKLCVDREWWQYSNDMYLYVYKR